MDAGSELKIGIIGGTGIGQLLSDAGEQRRHEVSTPFGWPSDVIVESSWGGVPVFLLARHGVGHVLSPGQVPYRANIFALKQLGCTHVIATGAVGSLREEFKPRDLVVPEQVIDKTFGRVGTFYEKAAVHVEFATPFCGVLRKLLIDAGTEAVHSRGCYVAMEGPAFSTRAESLMHRLWGGDLIGMTAMPEAKLAREAELSYALLALVTDYDSWKAVTAASPGAAAPTPPAVTDPSVLLREIMENLQAASGAAMGVIRRAIEMAGERRDELLAAPSREALKLAIWTDKSRIEPGEVERLLPLWGRYFQ